MAFKEITSRQNHFIKYALSLKDKKRRDIEKSCLIEGKKILCDLADKNFSLRMFFISQSAYNSDIESAEKIAKRTHFNFLVTDNLMETISTTETTAGFLAIAETPIQTFIEFELDANGCYLMLDNIQDPGNCGTIFRSAAAFKIDGIILYGNCTDIYGPKTIRASSGQTLLIKTYKIDDIENLRELKKSGLSFYGTGNTGEILLENFNFPCPLAIVMGNEGKGLSKELEELISQTIKIKISGEVESLNVSVAASIVAWQRFLKK